MAALTTPEVTTGLLAPAFSLKGVDGTLYNLERARGKNGLLVMFICNHCPFVKAVLNKIIRDTEELKAYGIGSIAIMSNDTTDYPDDSFDAMQYFSREKQFPFPYVIDETQQVAKAYGAVCTPDFFGFNAKLALHYRGRLDASRMDNIPQAPRELFDAMVTISQTGKGPASQLPSIGCSIKWKGRAA